MNREAFLMGTQHISCWWLGSPVLPPLTTCFSLKAQLSLKAKHPPPLTPGASQPSALDPRFHPLIVASLLQASLA